MSQQKKPTLTEKNKFGVAMPTTVIGVNASMRVIAAKDDTPPTAPGEVTLEVTNSELLPTILDTLRENPIRGKKQYRLHPEGPSDQVNPEQGGGG